jgi:hypothetical protein
MLIPPPVDHTSTSAGVAPHNFILQSASPGTVHQTTTFSEAGAVSVVVNNAPVTVLAAVEPVVPVMESVGRSESFVALPPDPRVASSNQGRNERQLNTTLDLLHQQRAQEIRRDLHVMASQVCNVAHH